MFNAQFYYNRGKVREGGREREKTMFTHTYTCMLPCEQLQKFNPQIKKKFQIAKLLFAKYSMYDVCMFLVSLMDWRGNTWSVLARN